MHRMTPAKLHCVGNGSGACSVRCVPCARGHLMQPLLNAFRLLFYCFVDVCVRSSAASYLCFFFPFLLSLGFSFAVFVVGTSLVGA